MARPWWRQRFDVQRSWGGAARARRARGSLARALALQEDGDLEGALVEAKNVLALVRRTRREERGGTAEIMVLGAHLVDELATALGVPELARAALEDALLVIEEVRRTPSGDDAVCDRHDHARFEPWLLHRLAELRSTGRGGVN